MTPTALVLVLASLTLTDTAPFPGDVGPDGPWCDVINAAQPGQTVTLTPGTYREPCAITAPGVTVAGALPGQLPVFAYEGDSSNLIDILADDVTLSFLEFGPSAPGVDAVKIKSGDRTRVHDCVFRQIGGISIAANTQDSHGIFIRGNIFRDLMATAIYLGCHGGKDQCAARAVTVSRNWIDGVVSSGVGYGVQLKLDSTATIEGNVIANTQGPGIMVYGAAESDASIVVTRNLVVGSTTAAAIELGGGPARVTNNVVVGGAEGGIYSYDYQDRGMVDNIAVIANSVVGEGGAALRISDAWVAPKNVRLVANAAWQRTGTTSALPPVPDGLLFSDNVDCADPSLCWVDAANRDFWPVPDGPLAAGYTQLIPGDSLPVDWCSFARTAPPTIGALQLLGGVGPGPLPLMLKQSCPAPAVDTPEVPTAREVDPDSDLGGGSASTGEPADGSETLASDTGGCGASPRPQAPLALLAFIFMTFFHEICRRTSQKQAQRR